MHVTIAKFRSYAVCGPVLSHHPGAGSHRTRPVCANAFLRRHLHQTQQELSETSIERTAPGRFTATNVTLGELIQFAFGIGDFQLSGGPGWLRTDRFDILATTPTPIDLNDNLVEPYLRTEANRQRTQRPAIGTCVLNRELGRTAIDNTSLKGQFDLTLEWSPDSSPDSNAPSLTTALQQQLGLRLESTKGPVETIVVEEIEKPTVN